VTDPAFAQAVGARLRAARRRAGLRQIDLDLRVGILHSEISRYETGVILPSCQTLRRLCDGLQVSADWVLGRTEGVIAL
jgi:transcriptional regulator with XRE-family HTH domain